MSMTLDKPAPLNPSSSPLARYEAFLIQNSSTIATIESSLRSLTWFLPGRFKDAELASESLTALLNLMSLYHDTLLARRLSNPVDPSAKSKLLIPPSEHSRYTRAWSDKRSLYRWAARSLEVIRFVQLVVEMGLRRKLSKLKNGPQNIWRAIVAIEAVKATLRLVILRITKRPLLFPPIPERELDPATLGEAEPASPTHSKSPSHLPPRTPDHIKNNRTIFPPTPPSEPSPLLHPVTGNEQDVDAFLLNRALTPASVKPPTTLVKPLIGPKDWLSEVLYIVRPLAYVITITRFKTSTKLTLSSSTPLILSLTLDFLSRYLRRSPSAAVSTIERSEYARRDRDLLWYLLRGTIWEEWSRPKISGFADRMSGVPVLGVVGALVKDWMPLIDDYYYYTSV